jgi:hypothetical protein
MARSNSPVTGSNAARSCRRHSISRPSARALQLLGVARLEMGDLRGARAALAKGVPAIVDIGDRFAIPAGLSALAGLAAKEGRPRAALALAGAAAEYEHVNHTYRAQAIRAYLDTWLVPVRSSVGAAAAKLLDEGRRMTLDEAIALGLDDRPEDPVASRRVTGPDPPRGGGRGAGRPA